MTLVLGVDGCPGGWCVVPVRIGDHPAVGEPYVAPDFPELLKTDAATIAVDIPNGLLDRPGPRSCDSEARRMLGRRSSCVFSPPSRAALLHLDDYRRACDANREVTGRMLSRQSFGIAPKIKEVDDAMTPAHQERVREAHPELAFRALNRGLPVSENKKTADGTAIRWLLLQAAFSGLPSQPPARSSLPSRCSTDDYIDALACAWTAVCITRRLAVFVPDSPETDAKGLRMEMWMPPVAS
jgi:predicted RNase H-like nuclease